MMKTNVPMILAAKKLDNVNIPHIYVTITTNVQKMDVTPLADVPSLMYIVKKRTARL
jgi:hypothetical protein